MRRSQSGFTLIELVVVIVILGILAATALPRFINLTSDARLASAKALLGSLNSASELVQARYIASGSSGSTINMGDGTTVTVVSGATGGQPTADAAGIEASMKSTTGFPSPVHASGVSTYTLATSCTVLYTQSTGVATLGVTSGC